MEGSRGRRAAVLGHPVAHSLSPVLHRAAYAALCLAGWRYDAVDVTEEDLPRFVAELDGSWAGLSLTMPLKRTVLPLLDHVEPQALALGVVNTVLVAASGSGIGRTLTGTNTDVHGLLAALREGGVGAHGDGSAVGSAVVLGAGATAASAIAALAQLGCPAPTVVARSEEDAALTRRAARGLGLDPRFEVIGVHAAAALLGDVDVVVSTLPPGIADPTARALAGPVRGVLLDCAYDPRPTALVTAWRAAGGASVSGERMLLHQAGEQVRLMTGRAAPLGAMDVALRKALGG
jgi:shikimate dehydrogenase